MIELMINLDTIISLLNGLCQLVWDRNVEWEVLVQISKGYRYAEWDLRYRLSVAGKGQKGELIRELTAFLRSKNICSCEQTFSI